MHALSEQEFLQQRARGQFALTLSYERYLELQRRRAARATCEFKALLPSDRKALNQLRRPRTKAPTRRAA